MTGAGATTMGCGSQAGLLKLYSNLVMDLPRRQILHVLYKMQMIDRGWQIKIDDAVLVCLLQFLWLVIVVLRNQSQLMRIKMVCQGAKECGFSCATASCNSDDHGVHCTNIKCVIRESNFRFNAYF